jgi:glucosamine-6-phosphate deaminase
MQLEVFSTIAGASGRVADLLAMQVNARPWSVLGLATGATPVPIYQELVARVRQGRMDLSRVSTFNLDEYAGLNGGDPYSFTAYMHQHFFDPLELSPLRTFMPPNSGDHLPERVRAYDERIRAAGGIDWQLLGIGRNGHIGFNEPGTPFDSPTHLSILTDSTRRANASWFGHDMERVPLRAVTMGLGTIMRSRVIVLAAFGANKAEPLKLAFAGAVSEAVPASILQRHPRAFVIADEPAARLLQPLS